MIVFLPHNALSDKIKKRLIILFQCLGAPCNSCPGANQICAVEPEEKPCELTCRDLLTNALCADKPSDPVVETSICVCAPGYYRDDDGACVNETVCAYCEINGQV